MRFIHTADLHLDAPMTGQRYRGKVRRSALSVLAGMIQYAQMQKIKFIVIAGDLFDSPTPEGTAAGAAFEMMRQAPIQFLIAAGNHDPLTETGYCGLKMPDNVYVFGKTPEIFAVPGGAFIGASFYGGGVCYQELPPCTGSRVGVFHGDIGADIAKEWIEQSGLDYLALGHIHKGYQKKIGHTHCAMPGSPAAHGFDECGNRFFLDVRVEKGTVECVSVPCEGSLFFEETVALSEEDSASEVLGKLMLAGQRHSEQDVVRLRVTGHTVHPVARRLADLPQVTEILDETRLPTDLNALAKQPTLKGRFVAYMCEKMEENPDRREQYEAALRLGLEAFEK